MGNARGSTHTRQPQSDTADLVKNCNAQTQFERNFTNGESAKTQCSVSRMGAEPDAQTFGGVHCKERFVFSMEQVWKLNYPCLLFRKLNGKLRKPGKSSMRVQLFRNAYELEAWQSSDLRSSVSPPILSSIICSVTRHATYRIVHDRLACGSIAT
jgi:hypothetical protein